VEEKRQTLPAALRIPDRAVRDGRLAQRLDEQASLLESIKVGLERAMLD
jgi:hypothetical protein